MAKSDDVKKIFKQMEEMMKKCGALSNKLKKMDRKVVTLEKENA